MTARVLYVDNDMRLEVSGLRDLDGNYLNSATVSATIYDSLGVAVAGQSWPLNLAYVLLSNGIYRGIIDDGAGFIDGKEYTIVIEATYSGNKAKWTLTAPAQIRNRWSV